MGEAASRGARARPVRDPAGDVSQPVLGRGPGADKKLIARLQAADDLPGLPLDSVLATEAYAAQAKFDQGDAVRLVPVGRAAQTLLVGVRCTFAQALSRR